jgi:hypothetical protein
MSTQRAKVFLRLVEKQKKSEERINKNIKDCSRKSYFNTLIDVLRRETGGVIKDEVEGIKELFEKWIPIGERHDAQEFLKDNSICIGLPPDQFECSCTHKIRKNFFILNFKDANKENYKILNIGSCCIKKFIGNNTKTFKCIRCDVLFKSRRRRNENICDLCIIDYDKEIKEKNKIKTCLRCRRIYTRDRQSSDYFCCNCKERDGLFKEINKEEIKKVHDLKVLEVKINNLKKNEPGKKYKLQDYNTNENITRLIDKCLLKQNNNYDRDQIIDNNYIDTKMFNLEIKDVKYFNFLDIVNKYKLHKKLDCLLKDDVLLFGAEYSEFFGEPCLSSKQKINRFLEGKLKINFGKYKNHSMKDLKDYGYINWIKRVFTEKKSSEDMILAGCYYSYFKDRF